MTDPYLTVHMTLLILYRVESVRNCSIMRGDGLIKTLAGVDFI
jgi:hypothetical protein